MKKIKHTRYNSFHNEESNGLRELDKQLKQEEIQRNAGQAALQDMHDLGYEIDFIEDTEI